MSLEPPQRRRKPSSAPHRFLLGAALVWSVLVLAVEGYRLRLAPQAETLHRLADALVVVTHAVLVAQAWRRERRRGLRSGALEAVFLALAVFLASTVHAGTAAVIVRRAPGALRRLLSAPRGRATMAALYARPMLALALGFLVPILLGCVCLTFPAATEDGRGAPFLVALFTSTSATCVTGLIVVDTPAYFSLFGELVILGLIQIGGLGIMTLSAAFFLLMGRRISARQRRVLATVLEETSRRDVTRAILDIFRTMMAIETAGAVLLFLRWRTAFADLGTAAYQSVFHAVSAFCNAGFSLLSTNLATFVADPWVNAVVAALVVLGGLGFIVLADLVRRDGLRRHSPTPRVWLRALQMHTKVVLVTSACLVVGGAILLFHAEFDRSLAPHSVPVKLQAAVFQSVSARTAGFNTVDISLLSPLGIVVLCALMFVGGSPGGTAGGIKTTSLAALVLAVRAILRGRDDVEAFGRTIEKENLYRVQAVGTISIAVVVAGFALLLATQALDFAPLLFECVSAFGTVGLSMGATPGLDATGRLLVILLMFVGRVGPLSLALAVSEKTDYAPYRFPSGRLLVG